MFMVPTTLHASFLLVFLPGTPPPVYMYFDILFALQDELAFYVKEEDKGEEGTEEGGGQVIGTATVQAKSQKELQEEALREKRLK